VKVLAETEQVILVDEKDRQMGFMGKMEAHEKALLHRAFSIFIFNAEGEMLLQQRAYAKYHSGGLWTNACCSHPRPGESTVDAAHRRLAEEMGVRCNLQPLFTAQYRAAVSNGYIEDEVVHVFGGTYEGAVTPDPAEVADWKWISLATLIDDLDRHPEHYTIWFRHYLREHLAEIARWMERG